MFTYGIKVPMPLMADAYTVGSGTHVSEDAKDHSVYQMIARKRPEWMDTEFAGAESLMGKIESRFVWYGLGFVIYDLLSEPLTHEYIDRNLRFLTTFYVGGKQFKVDEKIWRRVVDEHNGIPPIVIRGFKDGETYFIGEPTVQVYETQKGFGELAAYFEAVLTNVWFTSEEATLMRHTLDFFKALVKYCTPRYLGEDELNFLASIQLTDFGMRASSCPQESERAGLATLLSFPGTDTMNAAYIAWVLNNEKQVGGSVKALAHRIVQGYKKESDAYRRLFESEPGMITSHVNDCYSSVRAMVKDIVPLGLRAKKEGGVVVAREDSGDDYEELLMIYNEAKEAGLAEVVHKGLGLHGMTSLKGLAGNGLTISSMIDMCMRLIKAGYSPPHCGLFGMGGFKRNLPNRDNLGMTYKLCEVGEDKRPVMKFSNTPGKGSIPGMVKICREIGKPTVRHLDEPGEDIQITWFDGSLGKPFSRPTETFDEVRARVVKDFHKFPLPTEVLSDKIKAAKKTLYNEYVS